jgi:hypothetical protein
MNLTLRLTLLESTNTPVMSTAKTTELELLLKIEQYKYKMMWFEHYHKPISGPRPLCKEHIEQSFPELVEFCPAEGAKMEVEDGEEVDREEVAVNVHTTSKHKKTT